MNRKDCEHIGYLLSVSTSGEELRNGLLEMDPRIEPEFKLFEEVKGNDEATMDRYRELMTEEYGDGWAFSKRCREEGRHTEFMERAKQEILTQ